MKVPLSWLKDFVDVDLSLVELARVLTSAGLEVDAIQVMGLPMPEGDRREFKIEGLSWDPTKIVVAQIDEVMPHPNADRLTLCRLNDGTGEYVVLTGAPNLYDYKGKGPLPQPLKVAYAREGSKIYDGHQPGLVLTTLKRAKIRGVESFSMVCSEKELGISDEHEGVIILDPDAPTGMPLVDYMGDAVFEVSILPNMIRNACILGVAREVSALTGKPLRKPQANLPKNGPSIEGKAFIQITDPELNPRFVVGLIEGVTPQPSPYWVQRRLRLAGMRPINSVVDATNYVMLELGEPLHAFDYDVLVKRAGGKAPTIITRVAQKGEVLTTLDEVERKLDDYMILVCDTAGSLSLAGVMGGLESEVTDSTRNILLEGASWNFINVRKTATNLHMSSEAGYRFARGVHPALAPQGVELGLQRMAEWSGGQIYSGLVDNYPVPRVDPKVMLTAEDIWRWLGIELDMNEVATLLRHLEFEVTVNDDELTAQTPPHRLDIGEGVIGKADLIEEIARLYSYDRIPETQITETMPELRTSRKLDLEMRLKNLLVSLGLQELITYRLTSPEREARYLKPVDEAAPFVEPERIWLANPIASDRTVMRHSLAASVLEIVEKNARNADRLAMFEIGEVFLPVEDQVLPDEPRQLVIALTGMRHATSWDVATSPEMDFFDLKGILEAVVETLHVQGVSYVPAEHGSFHPGKCASLKIGDQVVGVFGELHPQLKARYDFGNAPVLLAEFDLETLLAAVPFGYSIQPVPVFPAVLEDIAVVVDETVPAVEVEALIRQTGGKLLTDVRLFDIFRSEQIGAGKKSLAYSLTYQAADHTLNNSEATQIRQKIIRRLEQVLGAKLRS